MFSKLNLSQKCSFRVMNQKHLSSGFHGWFHSRRDSDRHRFNILSTRLGNPSRLHVTGSRQAIRWSQGLCAQDSGTITIDVVDDGNTSGVASRVFVTHVGQILSNIRDTEAGGVPHEIISSTTCSTRFRGIKKSKHSCVNMTLPFDNKP